MPQHERITISSRGVVTIPAALRRVLGLKPGDDLIAEATPDGILLRPAVSIPVETYTEDQIAELRRDEPELARRLGKSS